MRCLVLIISLTAPLMSTADLKVQAEQLVRRLGSDTFAEREEANRALRRLGTAALPVIREAVRQSKDPEVVNRCRRLLAEVEAEQWAQRLRTFLEDPDDRQAHDLPGWQEFRAIVGGHAAARTFFAGMLCSAENREVLAGLALPREQLTGRVVARTREIEAAIRSSGLNAAKVLPEDIAVLLLAEVRLGERHDLSIATFILAASFQKRFAEDALRTLLAPLFVRWIETRPTGFRVNLMNMACVLGLPHGIKLAEQVLQKEAKDAAHYRAMALMTLAKLGGKAQIGKLKSYFADEAVLHSVPNEIMEVRDVALVMCLLVADKDPREFGFQVHSTTDKFVYHAWSYTQAPAKQRPKAFAKWREVEAFLEQPIPKK